MRESQLSFSAVPARGTGTDHLGWKGPSSSMTKLKRNAEIAPDPHIFGARYLSNVKILGHFGGGNCRYRLCTANRKSVFSNVDVHEK